MAVKMDTGITKKIKDATPVTSDVNPVPDLPPVILVTITEILRIIANASKVIYPPLQFLTAIKPISLPSIPTEAMNRKNQDVYQLE